MDECLALCQNVCVEAQDTWLIGDLFLVRDDCVFVAHTSVTIPPLKEASEGGKSMKYTVAGAMMGGIAGAILGAALDTAKDEVLGTAQPKPAAVDMRRINSLVSKAADRSIQLRPQLYGLHPLERKERKGGWLLDRKQVVKVSQSQDSDGITRCKLKMTDGSFLPFLTKTESLAFSWDIPSVVNDPYQSLQSWLDGSLEQSPDEQMEGCRVGVGIEDFFNRLKKTDQVPLLTDDQLRRMALDNVYMDLFSRRLTKFLRRQRVVDWLRDPSRESLMNSIVSAAERDAAKCPRLAMKVALTFFSSACAVWLGFAFMFRNTALSLAGFLIYAVATCMLISAATALSDPFKNWMNLSRFRGLRLSSEPRSD